MDSLRPIQVSSPLRLRLGERRAILMFGDFLMALFSLVLALFFWGISERFYDFPYEFLQKRTPLWFYFLPIIWMVLLIELYDIHNANDWKKTIRGIAVAALAGTILYLVLFFYYVDPPRSLLPRRGVLGFLVTASVLTLVWRGIYIRIFTTSRFMRNIILVGGGNTGIILLQVVNSLKVKPFSIIGIIDDDPQKQGMNIEGYKVLGSSEDLLRLVEKLHISDVFVAITGEIQGRMFQALLDAQQMGVDITRMPVVYEELLGRVPIQSLEANWILRSFVDEARVSGFYELGKRILDIIGGMIGTIGMLIVFPFVAIGIMLDDGRPIFYGQMRSGRGGHPYRILKFRTMRRDAEADGLPKWASEDDKRATRVGKILRRTHFDELPQFLNVLRGEMSLVGPRAERPELVSMFQSHIPFYRARLLVKPGITGWAQVNYGYASSVEETMVKLEYDLYYIKHRRLMIDLVILLRTPSRMLGFRGR